MGRRMKAMTMEEAQGNSRRVGKYSVPCRKCPKHAMGYCSIFAKFVDGRLPVCNYGKLAIRSARQKEKWSVYAPHRKFDRKDGKRDAAMMKNKPRRGRDGGKGNGAV